MELVLTLEVCHPEHDQQSIHFCPFFALIFNVKGTLAAACPVVFQK